jgi:hypothetical protein
MEDWRHRFTIFTSALGGGGNNNTENVAVKRMASLLLITEDMGSNMGPHLDYSK